MEKHIFYKKYANIPLPLRHIVSPGTVRNQLKDSMSPWELYKKIHDLDNVISEAKEEQEKLLEFAENVISKSND